MSWQNYRTKYAVVINHEEQYSLWPADQKVPSGMRAVGKEGSAADCVKYIEEVWTDKKPQEIRQKIEADLKKLGRG